MDINTSPLSSIGIDIGKEVFHIVGFSANGKIAFRRKIKRLALADLQGLASEYWVKNRSDSNSASGPLRPNQQTFSVENATSVLGQWPTLQ